MSFSLHQKPWQANFGPLGLEFPPTEKHSSFWCWDQLEERHHQPWEMCETEPTNSKRCFYGEALGWHVWSCVSFYNLLPTTSICCRIKPNGDEPRSPLFVKLQGLVFPIVWWVFDNLWKVCETKFKKNNSKYFSKTI